MARIPDAPTLAGNPARASMSLIEAPKNNVGDAIAGVGKSLQKVGSDFLQMQNEDDELDYKKAKADYLTKKIELDDKYDNDTDYVTRHDRYAKDIEAVRTSSANTVKNTKLRETFLADTDVDKARSVATQRNVSRTIEGQTNVTYADNVGEQLISRGLKSKDPEVRNQAIQTYTDLIDSNQKKGYLTPAQANEKKKRWKGEFAKADFRLRVESGDIDSVISDIEKADERAAKAPLIKAPTISLSISDKTVDAGFGFKFGKMPEVKGMIIHHTAGQGDVDGVISTFKQRNFPAQFVIDRDGTIHQTLPEGARGQHMRNGQGKGAGLSNSNMEGVEIIAKNDADVTPAQKEAAIRLVAARSEKFGYDPTQSVFGHGEVNGHKEHDEGMTIVSEIRGGAISKTQQASQPKDGNVQVASSAGVTATDATEDSTQTQSSIYDDLNPSDRAELLVRAKAEKERYNAGKSADAYSLRKKLDDDIASRSETGIGVEGIDINEVTDKLGEKVAYEYQEKLKDASVIYQNVSGMDKMDNGKLVEHIISIKPKAGEENYATKSTVYDNALKKYNSIKKLRTDDPALAAQSYSPEMINPQLINSFDKREDGSGKAIFDARIETQKAMGIPEYKQSPLTKEEEADFLKPLKKYKADDLPQEVVSEWFGDLKRIFGDKSDEVFFHLMKDTLGSDELARAATGTLSRLLTGSSSEISLSDTQRLSTIVETNSATKAFGQPEEKIDSAIVTEQPEQPEEQGGKKIKMPSEAKVSSLKSLVDAARKSGDKEKENAVRANFDRVYGNGSSLKLVQ